MMTARITARIAELPATPGAGEDRTRVTSNAVVVLDGASGTDLGVSVSEYVDSLADRLMAALDSHPSASLTSAVTAAIEHTTTACGLAPRHAPSSTVSIVRRGAETVDVLVLGDSPVYVSHLDKVDRVTDNRLKRLDLPSRTQALARLAAGGGYDDTHASTIRMLSSEKAPHMNRPGGYWIAEADSAAGRHALVRSYPANDVPWCAILTDGADDPVTHLGLSVAQLAELDEDDLHDTLRRLHDWEAVRDPDGHELPRFKRHDDKTIAIVRFQ